MLRDYEEDDDEVSGRDMWNVREMMMR